MARRIAGRRRRRAIVRGDAFDAGAGRGIAHAAAGAEGVAGAGDAAAEGSDSQWGVKPVQALPRRRDRPSPSAYVGGHVNGAASVRARDCVGGIQLAKRASPSGEHRANTAARAAAGTCASYCTAFSTAAVYLARYSSDFTHPSASPVRSERPHVSKFSPPISKRPKTDAILICARDGGIWRGATPATFGVDASSTCLLSATSYVILCSDGERTAVRRQAQSLPGQELALGVRHCTSARRSPRARRRRATKETQRRRRALRASRARSHFASPK